MGGAERGPEAVTCWPSCSGVGGTKISARAPVSQSRGFNIEMHRAESSSASREAVEMFFGGHQREPRAKVKKKARFLPRYDAYLFIFIARGGNIFQKHILRAQNVYRTFKIRARTSYRKKFFFFSHM